MRQLIKSETVRERLDMPKATFERHVKQRTQGMPSPIYIGRARFFDAAEIEAWLTNRAAASSNDRAPERSA
jgi:predicted DNA-binding transcriptional regulator AlpA